MATLDSVDLRTNLAGTNRLEMLVLNLGGRQLYGINVFKIKEILSSVKIFKIPGSSDTVVGTAYIRGITIPVVDLRLIIENRRQTLDNATVVVTEYNRSVQAFLVGGVERIINVSWDEIRPLPKSSGHNTYLTAVVNIEEKILEIIDVEKVLNDISPQDCRVSSELKEEASTTDLTIQKKILACDDSAIARKHVVKVLSELVPDIEVITAINGKEMLDRLRSFHNGTHQSITDEVLMLISDIEMPELDGYMLTTEIRNDPFLKDLFVVLHSSLSGGFNMALIEKVGADKFVSKFAPDAIARAVLDRVLHHNQA